LANDTKYIEQLIIEKVVLGDKKAFEELYYRYADKLYYFAFRFLKTREDAEGLTQDVFIKIWETRERLDPENSFNSYLFTIAKNTIFNLHRKKLNEFAYRDYLKQHFDELYSKTENDIMLAELNATINKCVEKFPPVRKKVFELSRKKGLSYKEISDELNISDKTIETHIRLALKTIREVLKAETFLSVILYIALFQ